MTRLLTTAMLKCRLIVQPLHMNKVLLTQRHTETGHPRARKTSESTFMGCENVLLRSINCARTRLRALVTRDREDGRGRQRTVHRGEDRGGESSDLPPTASLTFWGAGGEGGERWSAIERQWQREGETHGQRSVAPLLAHLGGCSRVSYTPFSYTHTHARTRV